MRFISYIIDIQKHPNWSKNNPGHDSFFVTKYTLFSCFVPEQTLKKKLNLQKRFMEEYKCSKVKSNDISYKIWSLSQTEVRILQVQNAHKFKVNFVKSIFRQQSKTKNLSFNCRRLWSGRCGRNVIIKDSKADNVVFSLK